MPYASDVGREGSRSPLACVIDPVVIRLADGLLGPPVRDLVPGMGVRNTRCEERQLWLRLPIRASVHPPFFFGSIYAFSLSTSCRKYQTLPHVRRLANTLNFLVLYANRYGGALIVLPSRPAGRARWQHPSPPTRAPRLSQRIQGCIFCDTSSLGHALETAAGLQITDLAARTGNMRGSNLGHGTLRSTRRRFPDLDMPLECRVLADDIPSCPCFREYCVLHQCQRSKVMHI